VAWAPAGQVSRRSDGSNTGQRLGGEQAMIPLSPSTMTLRASPRVAATKAIRAVGSVSAT